MRSSTHCNYFPSRIIQFVTWGYVYGLLNDRWTTPVALDNWPVAQVVAGDAFIKLNDGDALLVLLWRTIWTMRDKYFITEKFAPLNIIGKPFKIVPVTPRIFRPSPRTLCYKQFLLQMVSKLVVILDLVFHILSLFIVHWIGVTAM